MVIDFKDKNILISGAAGHLGKQLIDDYANSGVNTLLLIDLPKCKDVLEKIKNKYKEKINIKIYTGDIRNVNEIKVIAEEISKDKIGIDILINNAGINILKKTDDMDEEDWDWVLDVNLKGSFFLTKEIAHRSLISRKGNVIFISSQHGLVGNVMRSAYCSSKSALLGLARALTAEWSAYDVRVNTVSPTYIINEENEQYLMGAREKRNMLNKIPLYKYAKVNDVSSAVLFLSSDKASMITGINLLVDGGYTSI